MVIAIPPDAWIGLTDTAQVMIIAQISDTHIKTPGTEDPWTGGALKADANKCLRHAIERINTLVPLPDVLIITGDLASYGLREEYREFKRILEACRVPFYVIPGNHDSRRVMREELDYPHVREHPDFVQYVVEGLPVRLIALDSMSDEHGGSEFCPARAAWFEEKLLEEPDRPTIVAIHHPPFETGIVPMVRYGTRWADGLNAILSRSRNIVRVICGHLHRSMFVTRGITTMSVCPASWWFQVYPEFNPDIGVAQVMRDGFGVLEPPQLQIHRWNGDHLITHDIFIEEFPRIPLPQELIDAVAESMEQGTPIRKKYLAEDVGDQEGHGVA